MSGFMSHFNACTYFVFDIVQTKRKDIKMANKFRKYCPNVWVAECESKHEKGEIIELETKYGKIVECEVHNFLGELNGKYLYSIVRIEEKTYAQRKAEMYENRQSNAERKSDEWYEKSQEGADFLKLAEPIKIGHHSERRHRALIERNWKRMGKSVEFSDKAKEAERKAEYWESKSKEITLAMPESLEYFSNKLEKAIAYHKGLKDGTIEREHSMSLQYANKKVKDLTKKLETAILLWGDNNKTNS